MIIHTPANANTQMKALQVTDYSRVQHIQIDQDHAGRRIDNYLFSLLKSVPKSRVYRILRKGEVRVNKSRVRQDYKLKAGDDIRIPPIRIEQKQNDIRLSDALRQRLNAALIFESDTLLVLNKPAGLPVHAGSGFDFGLIEAMRELRQELDYLELVHRLDRNTSGCLLMAKTPIMLRELNRMIRDDEVTKSYTTLLCGDWQQGRAEVDLPLRKNALQGGERMVQVDAAGKPARSIFTPVEHFRQLATLMEVELITGRTHQIRVHASHQGHPVAGDAKYGSKQSNKEIKKHGLKGLFLHARELRLLDPGTGRPHVFSAELPAEHCKLLEKLRND